MVPSFRRPGSGAGAAICKDTKTATRNSAKRNRKHVSAVREIEVDNPSILTDMDTPDDYQRLLRQHGATEGT